MDTTTGAENAIMVMGITEDTEDTATSEDVAVGMMGPVVDHVMDIITMTMTRKKMYLNLEISLRMNLRTMI